MRAVVELLAGARRLVIFTGAGVSAESGIPTFRDALGGLWARYDPAALATPAAFADDPALVWGWYEWRRLKVLGVQPNPAHRAIAALSGRIANTRLVTQNVDDLHERAGSATGSGQRSSSGVQKEGRRSFMARIVPVPDVAHQSRGAYTRLQKRNKGKRTARPGFDRLRRAFLWNAGEVVC